MAKSRIADNDKTIETAANIAEAITLLFGAAVIVGVGAEYVLPELKLVAIGNWPGAAVAIGVFGEILFSFRGTHLQGVLTARSSERLEKAQKLAAIAYQHAATAWSRTVVLQEELTKAIDRLAKAEREAAEARLRTAEIERLTAWRHVSPDQRDVIASEVAMIGASDIDLLVEFQMADPEAFVYSRELVRAFNRAGVTRIRWNANAYLNGIAFGLTWATSLSNANLERLRNALPPRQALTIPMDLSTHLDRSQPPPNLYVFVGPKPPVIDAEAELAEMGVAIAPTSDSNTST